VFGDGEARMGEGGAVRGVGRAVSGRGSAGRAREKQWGRGVGGQGGGVGVGQGSDAEMQASGGRGGGRRGEGRGGEERSGCGGAEEEDWLRLLERESSRAWRAAGWKLQEGPHRPGCGGCCCGDDQCWHWLRISCYSWLELERSSGAGRRGVERGRAGLHLRR
jgi:hypothetical protein